MLITTLAPWFGSNRTLAPAVGAELAGCGWVGIPFAGGMAELPCITARTIMVNDLHRAVVNLARVAADPKLGPELYRRLRRLPFHGDILAEAQRRCRDRRGEGGLFGGGGNGDTPDLDWATAYFVAVWMNRSGQAGTDGELSGNLPIRWNADGGDSATRYTHAVWSLPAWRRQVLRRCNFSTLDWREFMRKVKDEADMGVYCDPPFPGPGDAYTYSFSDDDHRELARRLAEFHAARVVCRFYEHELIRALYPEPRWTRRKLSGGRKQTNEAAPEVLVMNGPSRAKGKRV